MCSSSAQASGEFTEQDCRTIEHDPGPEWARRLRACCARITSGADLIRPNQASEELWLLVSTALSHYVDIHARRLGNVSPQDCEDIVARKAFDLLQRAMAGAWDQSNRSACEIARFISVVARNGLLDCLQAQRREAVMSASPGEDSDVALDDCISAPSTEESPDSRLHHKEFADALRRCAERLRPRARRIWFFRVFYEMSSREIANHPDVRMSCNHIDVILLRARKLLRDCMKKKGYDPHDMLPGTFVELWAAFRVPDLQKARGCHD
jgi:RNA polymerase sigma factor (sigma-70 family)